MGGRMSDHMIPADLSIPKFLQRPVTPQTKAAVTRINNELRRGVHRLVATGGPSTLSKGHAANLDEAGKALLREINQQAEAKKQARLAQLKGLRAMTKAGPKETALREKRGKAKTSNAKMAKAFNEAVKSALEGALVGAPADVPKPDPKPAVSDVTEISWAEMTGEDLRKPDPKPAQPKTKPVPRLAAALEKAKAKVAKAKAKPNGKLPETTAPLADLSAKELKAHKPGKAKAAKAKGAKKSGTKLEMIVALLKRKQGCTTKDVLDATGWPAVSMPQQAKAAGLKLRKEKAKGEPTRYYAS
jgi:hypothetical protein